MSAIAVAVTAARPRPHARALWLGGLLLCAVMWVSSSARAAASPAAAEKIQARVTNIDARTQSQSPLRERALQGVSTEGARVVAWGTTGAVEKISFEGLGERGRVLQDFYWQQGRLIAARERRIDYGANIMELPKDKPTPMNVVEDEWLEFAGDRLLRRRALGGELPVTDAAARQRVAKLKSDARSFKRLVNAPEAPAASRGSCSWSCAREQRGECLAYLCR
jgi:hypothetical protein